MIERRSSMRQRRMDRTCQVLFYCSTDSRTMKNHFRVFQYADYRQLLREGVKSKGFSYRTFSARHAHIVSFGMLAAALSKGRSGTKNKPARTFSVETVARIGKTLRFTEDELLYLVMLKLENDAEVLPGVYGGTFSELTRKLLGQHRERVETKIPKLKGEQYSSSPITLAAADLIDALPETTRARVSSEILPAAKAVLSRQRKKPGVRTLALTIERLEELTS